MSLKTVETPIFHYSIDTHIAYLLKHICNSSAASNILGSEGHK